MHEQEFLGRNSLFWSNSQCVSLVIYFQSMCVSVKRIACCSHHSVAADYCQDDDDDDVDSLFLFCYNYRHFGHDPEHSAYRK